MTAWNRHAYTITWSVRYRGGHDKDPGYRDARCEVDGREFTFTCDVDGSRPRNITSQRVGGWARLSAKNAAKRAPEIEAAMREWIRSHPDE